MDKNIKEIKLLSEEYFDLRIIPWRERIGDEEQSLLIIRKTESSEQEAIFIKEKIDDIIKYYNSEDQIILSNVVFSLKEDKTYTVAIKGNKGGNKSTIYLFNVYKIFEVVKVKEDKYHIPYGKRIVFDAIKPYSEFICDEDDDGCRFGGYTNRGTISILMNYKIETLIDNLLDTKNSREFYREDVFTRILNPGYSIINEILIYPVIQYIGDLDIYQLSIITKDNRDGDTDIVLTFYFNDFYIKPIF